MSENPPQLSRIGPWSRMPIMHCGLPVQIQAPQSLILSCMDPRWSMDCCNSSECELHPVALYLLCCAHRRNIEHRGFQLSLQDHAIRWLLSYRSVAVKKVSCMVVQVVHETTQESLFIFQQAGVGLCTTSLVAPSVLLRACSPWKALGPTHLQGGTRAFNRL